MEIDELDDWLRHNFGDCDELVDFVTAHHVSQAEIVEMLAWLSERYDEPVTAATLLESLACSRRIALAFRR